MKFVIVDTADALVKTYSIHTCSKTELQFHFCFKETHLCYIPFAGVAVLIHISEDSSSIIISSSGLKQFGPLKEANSQVTLPFRCLWISSLSLNCLDLQIRLKIIDKLSLTSS